MEVKNRLKLAGGFKAEVSFNNKVIGNVDFLVLEGEGEPILGTDTITKLGILKIEPEINNLAKDDSTAKIVDRHKSLFKGIGKLKDFQLKIPSDSSIETCMSNCTLGTITPANNAGPARAACKGPASIWPRAL